MAIPQTHFVEPAIVVNGTLLTPAQAKTVRAALAFFGTYLIDDGLGPEGPGAEQITLHSTQLDEVQALM